MSVGFEEYLREMRKINDKIDKFVFIVTDQIDFSVIIQIYNFLANGKKHIKDR